MPKILKMIAVLALAFGATVALPQQSASEFVVVEVRIDQAQSPTNVLDKALECVKNSACKAAVDAVFAYFGVNSTAATSAAANIKSQKGGNEGKYYFDLPAGYKYCRSRTLLVSMHPEQGHDSPFMKIEREWSGMYVYVETPKPELFAGRARVVANFQILGVRDDVEGSARASGKCVATSRPHTLQTCRGSKGHQNRGNSPCVSELAHNK